MRRLLYVPIIHGEADLGSAGAALAQKSVALSGERRWAIHKEAVARFWENVAIYLRSFDPRKLKVYQDGLAADGETGARIVEEAAAKGSQNYQLVWDLLSRGAELRKTEHPILLLRERENIRGLVRHGSAGEKRQNTEHYRWQRDHLMEERDKFIAETINATLREGELGVLFIGAYHNVVSRLGRGISTDTLIDPEVVKAYFGELFQGQDDKRLEGLAHRLSSLVDAAKR